MASRRLRRFLHLERARGAGAASPDAGRADPAHDRIAFVQQPSSTPAPGTTATGVALDRFGPEPVPRLEVEPSRPDARPFTRCVRCGTDHGRFAVSCAGCGTALDTDEQRRANDARWAAHRATVEDDARLAAERRATLADAAAADARARRSMYEALAREVGASERARLEADERLLGRGLGRAWSASAAALRWLRRAWVAARRRRAGSRSLADRR